MTTSTIYNETDAMWYVPLKVYLDSSKSGENIEGHLVATLEIDNNSSVSIYKFLNISSERDNEVDMLFMISQVFNQYYVHFTQYYAFDAI